MKNFKPIFFFILLFSTTAIFAQNKKSYQPPPQVENLPPVPNFSWINSCFGDTTCFINQTLMGNSYTWTVVGDTVGSHNTLRPDTLYKTKHGSDTNICFSFKKPGTYTVSVLAFNNHFTTMTKTIKIDTITKADFSFILCKNQFVNTSLCATNFYWDFGDGANSTTALPIHQYADTGTYMVTLIANNGNKSDTLKKSVHVSVENYANGHYIYTLSGDTLRVHATYTSHSSTSYNWTFGNSIFGTGVDSMMIYKDSTATYVVTLVTVNDCGPAYGNDTIHIIKIPPATPPANLDFLHSTLVIAPNPVSNGYVDAFYNSYNDNTYLGQVYNALGQKLFEEYFAFQFGVNEFKISTANLSSGVYVLVLQAGNSYIRQKFYIIKKP